MTAEKKADLRDRWYQIADEQVNAIYADSADMTLHDVLADLKTRCDPGISGNRRNFPAFLAYVASKLREKYGENPLNEITQEENALVAQFTREAIEYVPTHEKETDSSHENEGEKIIALKMLRDRIYLHQYAHYLKKLMASCEKLQLKDIYTAISVLCGRGQWVKILKIQEKIP